MAVVNLADLATYLREPRSIQQTSLTPSLLSDLTLKTIYFGGELTGQAIANNLHLPYANVVDQVLQSLIKEELVSVTGSSGFGDRGHDHVITQKGMHKVQEALGRCQYVGPAPVTLDVYTHVVLGQTVSGVTVTQTSIREAFSHLVVSDAMLRRIGPAVNSGRSLFLYGPPGNGKTTIAEAIASLLHGGIFIPYAVQVEGQTIQVYDARHHSSLPADAQDNVPVVADRRLDARWNLCRRPCIVTGGELTLQALDLIFDPVSKIYQAPYQMKANGGMLLIDDFGRQQTRPRDLLNRWIVPLDKRIDYLTLQTGNQIEIPFDALVAFSTNLNPADLVDDAFLRRIRHKILVPNPTWDEFREIFQNVVAQRGLVYDEQVFRYLVLEHYVRPKREPKSVHARDLIDQIVDISRYLEIEPCLTRELIDNAVEAYFVKL